MRLKSRWRSVASAPVAAAIAFGALAPLTLTATSAQAAETADALPDPTARGGYTAAVIQEAKFGTVALQEPNSSGSAPTAGTGQAAEDLEIRGQLYYPADRAEPSPVIVLVHGNHGSCDAGQNSATATCTQFKRNEAGYAYLAENLATWGYTTFSVSQDQLMMRQDSNKGKGMHQRRKLIAATLDALSAANQPGGLAVDEHTTIGTTLVGKLDMTRIGLMGHSRGGDAVSSFIDYNKIRTDGPRYPLRGVISLAPVDYERKAPTGVPYMTILPFCDGDVSNLQGARMFERSQYVDGGNQYPSIQVSHLGSIHNWYNTVWFADGGADGQSNNDAACGNSAPFASNNVHPHNIRLSGAASYTDADKNYAIDNSETYNPEVNTKISGDPERMGDQEKLGLATMAAFFRRYVGGEGAFDPYLTGELSDTDDHLQIPATACPTSESGTRIDCSEYVSTTYFPPSTSRVDVIRPEVENPLSLNALGGSLAGEGFANPYTADGGVTPVPATTGGGYDWCNPEPDDFAPAQLGKSTQPTGAKACPLPAKTALGGQNTMRESSPVNHSYGRQLSLAWETGQTAELSADIPAADADMSGLKALAMDADVNFFDTRNPGVDERGDNTRDTTSDGCTTALPCWPNEGPQSYDPTNSTQDFVIALTDTEGHEATVHAGDERWGNALHSSTGTNTPNTHIVLEQIRVPLSEFAAQGVDLTSLDRIDLRFGVDGAPTSGSIQLADVRFQEADADSSTILSDGADKADGAGFGPVTAGPDPAATLAAIDNSAGNLSIKDDVADEFNNTTWTVDDDGAQCSNAQFTSIQDAVDFASPWDTIVVCDGVYEESSTPIYHASNPVATGSMNGLTITKPLKIKGAGAGKVTIMPDQSLDTLAGNKPYLRDGGGNVITVSRQSLGSTDTNEMFVDISGVTVTAGDVWAEAGVAFFGAAGRVSNSVVGPMKVGSTSDELQENPHGWGIVKTGVIEGAGKGTVESEVTVTNSVVKGYQSGGILFDGGKGADGAAGNIARTGIIQNGYVTRTVVTGKANNKYAQTGVKFTNGVTGFVNDSRITGNYYRPDPAKSFGILLTDAGTETTGALTGARNVISGNGFAVWNGTADNSAVRDVAAPFVLTGSYVGTAAPTVGVPGNSDTGVEGVSASVTVTGRVGSAPATVPSAVGVTSDSAPTAELIDPVDATVSVGETIAPLVTGVDDFALKSATLLVNGQAVGTTTTSPYYFSWTAGADLAGSSVTMTAVVTDSSGQSTTSAPVTVSVAALPVEPITPTLALGTVTYQPKFGTAMVPVTVNLPGTVKLTAPRVNAVSVAVAGPGTVKLKVTPRPAYAKLLAKKGSLTVNLKLAYLSENGPVRTTTTVKLVQKVKK